MTYEAAFAIATVYISVLVVVNYCKRNRVADYQSKIFLLMVVDNGITGVAVSLMCFFRHYLSPCPPKLTEFFLFIYYLTHVVVVVYMFLYLFSSVRVWRELSKPARAAVIVPAALILLLLCANPFIHGIYRVTDEGVYERGPLLFLSYISFAYYMVLIAFVLIRYRRSFSIRRRIIFLIVLGIGVTSTMIQLFIPEMKVEICALAICALILFLFVQNPGEQIDPELNMLSRTAFVDRMRFSLLARKRFDLVVVLLPELDEYERNHGADRTSELLAEIGKYLSSLAANIELYHVEKNSFAMEIIMPLAGEVGRMLREIRHRFEQPFTAGGEEVLIKARLLRLILPTDLQDFHVLMGVMNRFVKMRNETRVMTAADFDMDEIRRARELSGALARAMEKKNFEIRFTPAYSFVMERILSAEISLRFFDEELGYVYDDELFRFAERSGHVLQLGELLFEEACRFISGHDLERLGISCIALSLHPAMCLQYRLMDRLQECIEKYKVDPKRITLMLSEYMVSKATPRFKESVRRLHETGVRFCLEDYGSGFTNVTSIFELPFSFLKINGSVVRSALGNEKARITMDSTLAMSRELNLMTVVEGIEDEDYFEMIRYMPCDLAKGNYFYEQLQEDEFLKVLDMKVAGEGGGSL